VVVEGSAFLSQGRQCLPSARSFAPPFFSPNQMNPPVNTIALKISPAAAGPAKQSSFYQRMVMDALERMANGCLHLELPDGMRKTIGDPAAKVSASVRIVNNEFFKRCVLYG